MGHAVHQTTQKYPRPLGRRTRVRVPFAWEISGVPVDLEAGAYTVRVWVRKPDGTVTGPFSTTVNGTVAEYNLAVSDLATASPTPVENVLITAVAENGTHVLVSDSREIQVGDWPGADTYTPL